MTINAGAIDKTGYCAGANAYGLGASIVPTGIYMHVHMYTHS